MSGSLLNNTMEEDLKFTGFFPVVVIALSNLALIEKLRELLDINVEQRSKRLLCTVFFGVHILTYSFMGPLSWWTMFVPVFPAVILAGAVSIYLTKMLNPFTEEIVTPIEDGHTFSHFLNTLGLRQGMTVMNGRTVKDLLETTKGTPDIINKFLVKISAQDPNGVKELSELYNNRRVVQTHLPSASSKDILFALYTCCDPILLQEVIRKVSLSGNAVPLLLPDCVTDEVTLLLWGLRKTTLLRFDSETSVIQDISVTNFPIMTISAIRFGKVSISKTAVLNKLLTLSYGFEERESFLSYSNDPHQSVWSQGTVECDWFISKKMSERNESHVPYALLNLRGDGKRHNKQVQLCTKISNIVIIFANSTAENELKPITENVDHVVLINCSSNATSIQPTTKLSIVQYTNLDPLQIVCNSILEIIKEKGGGCIAVEGIAQLCKDLDIRVDEQSSDHKMAKSHAFETIETFISEEESFEEIQGSPGTSLKMHTAKTFTSEQQKLYFAWLQMLLHNRNATALASAPEQVTLVTQKRHDMCTEINSYRSPSSTENKKNSDIEKQLAVQTEAMEPNIGKYERLTLHRLIRKLADPEKSKQKLADTPTDSLPQIFANALLNGVPLQIVEVDNYQSSIEWLGAVLDSLNKICDTRNTVRVMSVLSGTSTPKSSLLNSLFGTDFQVGVGKYSEGVVMQLVPVHNSLKQFLGCDFLVVVEAQGLDVAESKYQYLFDQNNQIVTTCCCISDVVIVNTNSTTPQEDTNHILEIVVNGLITAAETNGLPKCCLVQHIDRKTAKGLDVSLFEQLKLIVQRTTKVEGKDHLGQEILNYFCSDAIINIAFIPHIEASHGVKPSEEYSTNIMNLRSHLLQIVAKHGRSALTFPELYKRLVLVTERNFQNMNTETLRSELTEQYRKALLSVQQKLMEELTVACNGIKNSRYELMEHREEESKKNIALITERQYDDLHVKVKYLFQSRKHKPLKEQLHYFEKDLINSKESFMQVAVNHLHKTVQTAKQYQERDVNVRSECEQLFSKAKKLIEDSKIPPEEKEKKVKDSLNNHVAELKIKYPPPDKVKVQRDVRSTMANNLRACTREVVKFVDKKPVSEFSMNFHQSSTKRDIHDSKKKFNVVKGSHEKLLQELNSNLKVLSNDHPNFEQNSAHMAQNIKEFEEKIHSEVEDITVYLFLSSKFLCGAHNSQMKEELQLLDRMQNDSSSEGEGEVANLQRNNKEIKQAEPLHFASLTSKIEHFLTHWKTLISGGKFEILKQFMTVKNAQNCERLPSTFLTLKRLDRCFIDMIPELSSDNMTSINNIVNDAKLIVFSKALTKACLDLEETFKQIRGTIESSVLVETNKDEVQAAALVHLSAWSIDVLSIKSYEDLNESNPANAFEKLQGIFETTFKANLNGNCYEEVADVVCGDIQHALIEIIQSEQVNHLRASFLSRHDLFNVKKTFIGTVLRDLCKQDDYNGFVNFLEKYDEFSQKWILNFLAKECNREDDSLLYKFVQELITDKLNAVVLAIREALSDFKKQDREAFSIWLSLLYKKLMIYPAMLSHGKHFDKFIDNIKIINFQALTDELVSKVKKLDFQESLFLPELGNEDDTKTWLLSEGGNLHKELSQSIKGCTHQCPFCGAACEETLDEHDFHKTALHYPDGVNGWIERHTGKLSTDICTSNVASYAKYQTPQSGLRPYKDYKEDYPDWDIPAEDDQPMEFWRYNFKKFNKKFAAFHNCLPADIPIEWSSYSKDDAIRSVELAYNISQR